MYTNNYSSSSVPEYPSQPPDSPYNNSVPSTNQTPYVNQPENYSSSTTNYPTPPDPYVNLASYPNQTPYINQPENYAPNPSMYLAPPPDHTTSASEYTPSYVTQQSQEYASTSSPSGPPFNYCPQPSYAQPPSIWVPQPIPCGYNVIITFLGGTGLMIGDIISSDPYLDVVINNTLKYKTRVCQKTLNPVWNEVWSLANVPANSHIHIGVWDSDWLKEDDPLGEVNYVFDGRLGEYMVPLTVMYRNKAYGQLQVKFQVSLSEVPGPMRSLNFVKYTRFTSKLAGMVTSNISDDDIMSYSTYSIYFPGIAALFNNTRQHWNQKYPAAQQIFGKAPQSIVVRQLVRSEHYFLFKHDHTASYGFFQSGEAFLQFIRYGKRQGKNRFFNYATSAEFFKDFMSKHAVLSGCAEEVYYSGEFHIEQAYDGHYKLLLDNNSGTYAPDKNMLPVVAQLFSSSFPDLDVEAIDRSDPRIAQFKRANGIPVSSN